MIMYKKGDIVTIVASWSKLIFVNVRIKEVLRQKDPKGSDLRYYRVWRYRTANKDGAFWEDELYRAENVFKNAQEAHSYLMSTLNYDQKQYVGDPSQVIDEIPPVADEDIPSWNKANCSIFQF